MPGPRRAAAERAVPAAIACLLATWLASPAAATAVTAADVARVRGAVYPALVNLTVVHERFAEGRALRYPGAGSGVIVTPEGHVLTNYHVAGHTTRIDCTLTDGRVFEAEVLVDDPLTDLSVLRLRAPPGAAPFPYARFGDSSALTVGDPVFAMGNPLALSSSMTQGIVSNTARVFTDFTGSEMAELDLGEGQPSGLLTRWIQHDALILPGNSGGPLVDLQGGIVGINELGGAGFGFAIPSAIAREVLQAALAHGELRRGWLGFTVLPVRRLGLEEGALVASVLAGSPAAAAGVEPGDVLLRLGGEPVAVRFFEEVPLLYQRVAALRPGRQVTLVIDREGERRELQARTEPMPPFQGEEGELRELGLTVQEITPPMALDLGLAEPTGVLITGIRAGSPADAALPRLARQDVLVTVEGSAVQGLAPLRSRLAELAPDGELLVAVRREGEVLLSVVPPPRQPRGAWGGELPRPWVGIRTQVLLPELSRELGWAEGRGFRVTQVYPWTAASEAGLEVGDVVTALDGEALEPARVQDADDLRRRIEELYVGDTVQLTVRRDGRQRTVALPLEPRPPDAEEVPRAVQPELEFAVREATFYDRARRQWPPGVAGVVVTEALRGGWAQMAGLRLDDLILEVDGRPVPDVGAFENVLGEVLAARSRVVRIFLRRGARTHFVLIEPDWEEVSRQ
ncbi:MAG TPA: PDZ domain-containing protein [Thermoanaerobaculia bacterium]|nr:PDZ domain-containing protein [Thermoanaerobaculia bacterium]